MNTTCGIFFIDKNDKILIVHPTNASYKHWSIPKGGMDKGETHAVSAIRELKEETNITLGDYKGALIEIGESTYRHGKKKLHAFAFECKGKCKTKLKCDSLVNEKFPEVDQFMWVDFKGAFELLHYTQQELLQTYLKMRE
jgi:8-oxo-dGTP pyrophosphatase MutT (NUDIX family)